MLRNEINVILIRILDEIADVYAPEPVQRSKRLFADAGPEKRRANEIIGIRENHRPTTPIYTNITRKTPRDCREIHQATKQFITS